MKKTSISRHKSGLSFGEFGLFLSVLNFENKFLLCCPKSDLIRNDSEEGGGNDIEKSCRMCLVLKNLPFVQVRLVLCSVAISDFSIFEKVRVTVIDGTFTLKQKPVFMSSF